MPLYCEEYEKLKRSVVSQYYSPSTKEMFLEMDGAPAETLLEWKQQHWDAILIYSREPFLE